MLNVILMTSVLFVQLAPDLFTAYLPDDSQWMLYIYSLLIQVLLLAMLLVANIDINRTRKLCFKEIMAAVIFIGAMYQVGSFVFANSDTNAKNGISVSIENE